MDPICEEKINFLQKYVPFLANLIELLANDSEKEGKLAQMQLLYDLLNKPDDSVKIETLEKCEEVLSRVFANADEKQDDFETNEEAPGQNALIIHNALSDIALTGEGGGSAAEVICENLNGNAEQSTAEVGEKSSNTESTTIRQKSPVEDNCTKLLCVKENPKDLPEIRSPEAESENPQASKICEEKTQYEANENKVSTNATDTRNDSEDFHGSEIKKNGELVEENIPSAADYEATHEDSYENNYPIEDENSHADESDMFILPDDGESLRPLAEEDCNEDQENAHEEADDYEDQEAKQMSDIEPEDRFEEHPSDIIRQNQTEMLPFKIISAESLAIQSVKSLKGSDDISLLAPLVKEKNPESLVDDSENQSTTANGESFRELDPLDPLNSLPQNLSEIPKTVPAENGSISLSNLKDDEDDDDVLLIETRLSPICIDSDPEDEECVKQSRSLPLIPTKTNTDIRKIQQKQQRTSARKSTSGVMDTIRHIKHQNVSIRKASIHKEQKHKRDSGYLLKKDPKALMETINLIDSDSDDEKSKKLEKLKSNDDDVIIVSSTQPQRKIVHTKKTASVSPIKQNARFSPRSVNKHTAKPPTAQSNFLNAVNLQPAPKSNSNPASFSAQLSNKKVIIPNAFYGNPSYNRKPSSPSAVVANQDDSSSSDSVSRSLGSSSTVSISQVQDRVLKEWIESFLTNFASPLQLASHACFVLLQRVLKYRFFQRLKETRVNLNTVAKSSVPVTMDFQMLLDLRNVFLENGHLTDVGRRFCRFATNDAFGKPVALTTDIRTGKVTCRTRIGSKTDIQTDIQKTAKPCISEKSATVVPQVPLPNLPNATITSTNTVISVPTTPIFNTTKRNRKVRKLSDGMVAADGDDDDNDYTPYMGELVLEEQIVTERKKSLRTNRTKRKEAGFTYSEDHDDEEFEALAKKIEDKKREELRLAEERELEKERERERKTKKTVAKKTTSKHQGSALGSQVDIPKEPSRKKLRLADTEILGNTDDDLLTPTWIEADGDDDELDSLLDFADEPQSPGTHVSENDKDLVEDEPVSTQDSEDCDPYDVGTNKLLKNTDRGLHARSQRFDFCMHCLRRVPRTVHHYVNEHRSSEVFTSRLCTKDIRRLLTTNNVGFVNLYKGNQQQYAAHCIFCDKEAKFLLPYWYEHFTMHTGEYGFKCSGCNILKPTRSLLTNHLQSGSGCPKKGSTVKLHNFDTKSNQIEAYICSLCNYIQVHQKNILRHLRTQHEVETVSENHIIKVVLLQVSGPYRDQDTITNDESQLSLLQPSDEEENGVNGTSLDENSLMMQNDFTDNDDLSFMICGMLDVQTNLPATGDLMGKVNTTDTVDNK